MTRRALLIGSEILGLTGVSNDVDNMERALQGFGFEDIRRCEGEHATRCGIIAQFRDLITATAAEDAAVVYYAGHGADAREVDGNRIGGRVPEFILPFDIKASRANDFRGITSLELSMLLAELTQKSNNATVIMDCCHSGRMVRQAARVVGFAGSDDRRVRYAGSNRFTAGMDAHLERLKHDPRMQLLGAAANPHAIRILAARPSSPAFETRGANGKVSGVLTTALVQALDEADEEVSWLALAARVKELVQRNQSQQYPEIEGTRVARQLFKTTEQSAAGTTTFAYIKGAPALRGGAIMGMRPGDEYRIVPLYRGHCHPAAEVARVQVTEVHDLWAAVGIVEAPAGDRLEAGSRAFLLRSTRPAMPVLVRDASGAGQALRAAIAQSPFVSVSAAHERPRYAVDASSTGLLLTEPDGTVLRTAPRANDRGGSQEMLSELTMLAHMQHVLSLVSGDDSAPRSCTIDWGRVRNNELEPLPQRDAQLAVGDHFYVRIHNGSGKRVYASIFDVGVSGAVSLKSSVQASGFEIKPNTTYILGEKPLGVAGLPLYWPQGVPDDKPRTEYLLIFISAAPIDLRGLESRHVTAALFEKTREAGDVGDVGYAVDFIRFSLHKPSATAARGS